MHDVNGKPLHIGSTVHTYAYGFLTVVEVLEEHNEDEGGSLVKVIASHGAGKGDTVRTHRDKLTLVRSWKELAQIALDVQSACNLSGVVHSFSQVISEVRWRLDAEAKGGTDNINRHPACILFADKIVSLTGTQTSNNEIMRAYNWAHDITQT